MQYVAELDQYMLENEGSWALGEGFLSFVGQYIDFCCFILNSVFISCYKYLFKLIVKCFYFIGRLLNDDQLVSEVRETILNILAVAALKDDIILVLHQDRREHILMNYANGFDKLPLLERLALTLFVSIVNIIGESKCL